MINHNAESLMVDHKRNNLIKHDIINPEIFARIVKLILLGMGFRGKLGSIVLILSFFE
jgi:hypothetical protein